MDIAGAVAGRTMSSCLVCSDWRSARGNGVGIAVVRGFCGWESSLVRSRVAIPSVCEKCAKEWRSPPRPVVTGVCERGTVK